MHIKEALHSRWHNAHLMWLRSSMKCSLEISRMLISCRKVLECTGSRLSTWKRALSDRKPTLVKHRCAYKGQSWPILFSVHLIFCYLDLVLSFLHVRCFLVKDDKLKRQEESLL